MRLIHTADWQIGKVFRFVDDATMSLLQEARLDVISIIGRLAVEHGAETVLVAGDVYDHGGVGDRTLGQPLERMRAFEQVRWHLIPGNHDPYRASGLWDRLRRLGPLPANVSLHTTSEPTPLDAGGAWLLPAPLQYRAAADPTEWMNRAATPEGALRIGLAHGSVATFGSDELRIGNVIDAGRVRAARLDYLALGDWHGLRRIGERCWYSGTPEPDAFDVKDGGFALLVEIEAPGAPPRVEPLPTARYRWIRERATLHEVADIAALDERIRLAAPDPARLLVDLVAEGALPLALREQFEERIVRALGAAVCWLRLDDGGLLAAPSAEDLDAIARTGVVRAAAERLKRLADDAANPERALASEALVRLYLEQRKVTA